MLDTIKELFEGNESLFEELAIHEHWDWAVKYPTVHLSFATGEFKHPDGLTEEISDQLITLEAAAGITSRRSTPSARLRHLVRELHRATGQRVVLLVDEYDKPILDALDLPETAKKHREFNPWWFETGTPTFLVDILTSRGVPSLSLDSMIAGSALLSTFNVDDMATEALLLQTGYLTITGDTRFYRLG